jgi:hypothetical protein
MALYSRLSPQESRAADEVYRLIKTHANGVTFFELMRDHQEALSDSSSVLAAIGLLREEGKISTAEPWEGIGLLQNVRLYAKPHESPDSRESV